MCIRTESSYLSSLVLSNGAFVDYMPAFLKQALHEALMRQEDLLAYIDSQEDSKFRVSSSFSLATISL